MIASAAISSKQKMIRRPIRIGPSLDFVVSNGAPYATDQGQSLHGSPPFMSLVNEGRFQPRLATGDRV
jgi:hypothetical protein